jgi:hypothetical protein
MSAIPEWGIGHMLEMTKAVIQDSAFDAPVLVE